MHIPHFYLSPKHAKYQNSVFCVDFHDNHDPLTLHCRLFFKFYYKILLSFQ